MTIALYRSLLNRLYVQSQVLFYGCPDVGAIYTMYDTKGLFTIVGIGVPASWYLIHIPWILCVLYRHRYIAVCMLYSDPMHVYDNNRDL